MVVERGRTGVAAGAVAVRPAGSKQVLAIVLFAVALVYLYTVPRDTVAVYAATGIPALALLLALKLSMEASERRGAQNRKGDRYSNPDPRVGEEKVTKILDTLHGEWAAFHGVQSAGGQRFHVLISPVKGVFVILTNPVRGRVGLTEQKNDLLINGEPPAGDLIPQCLEAVEFTQNAIGKAVGLEMSIPGILAFPDAYVNVDLSIRGVTLQNAMCIEDYLWRHPDSSESPLIWEHRNAIQQAMGEG